MLLVPTGTTLAVAAPDYAARCRLSASLPLEYVGARTLSICKSAYAGSDAKAEFAWLVGRSSLAVGKNKDALNWIKKGADLGDADAAMAYAGIAERGAFGLAADLELSRDYLRRAADLSDAQAQHAYASRLLSEGDNAEAARYAIAAAEQGHVNAAFLVGNLYHAGVGVPKDMAMSLAWHKKAAALGSSGGAFAAGSILSHEIKNDQDLAVVLDFFYQANLLGESSDSFTQMVEGSIEKGQAWARHLRGIRLLTSNPPDVANGLRFLEESAASEDNYQPFRADALYNLGVASMRGLERQKDTGAAIRYYEQAAALGNIMAMRALAEVFEAGVDVSKDLGRAQEWLDRAASAGDAEAVTQLAILLASEQYPFDRALAAADAATNPRFAYAVALRLEEGRGVSMDRARARLYFEKAAEGGLPAALMQMSQYDDLDAATRLGYLTRAAEAGYVLAHAKLAEHYRETDPQQWEYWLHRAAAGGSVDAQLELGDRLMSGDGLLEDTALASKYIIDASRTGSVKALDALAGLYLTGGGPVEQSQEKAVELMQQIAARGENWALMQIGHIYANGWGGKPRNEAAAMQWYERAKQADVGDVADHYMADIIEGNSSYANGQRLGQFIGTVGTIVTAIGLLGESLGGGEGYAYVPTSEPATNHNCSAAMEAYAWSGIDSGRIGMWC